MSIHPLTESDLIAPCGMNCGICSAHLREKNRCIGCRAPKELRKKTRVSCKIKNCEKLKGQFCFECPDFPCAKLKHLDTRYKTKYDMSMIENLEYIRDKGLDAFIWKEKKRWACSACGGTVNVHKKICSQCLKIPV